MSARRFVTLILLLTGVAPAAAQELRTAVVPESANVGDIFHAAVRVIVPADVLVEFPDTLDVPDNVEAASRRQIAVDSIGPDRVAHTAVYGLTAWRPGATRLPPVHVRVDGVEMESDFPPIVIASVLPQDTSEIEPRPARDVIGPSRLIWPIALGLVLLAAVLAGLFWLYRRRKPAAVVTPSTPPRQIALAELDRIRRLGHLERGEIKPFYTAVADVLRRYTARLDPRWGAELTTTELWHSMARVLEKDMPRIAVPAESASTTRTSHRADRDGSRDAGLLYSMLGQADLVKFARARPAVREAETVWSDARVWVERFPPEPEPEREEEGK